MSVVVVRSYPTDIEARMGQAILEANGISSIVLRDDAGGMLPSLHLLVEVKLAVHEEDLTMASDILDGVAPDGETREPWESEPDS